MTHKHLAKTLRLIPILAATLSLSVSCTNPGDVGNRHQDVIQGPVNQFVSYLSLSQDQFGNYFYGTNTASSPRRDLIVRGSTLYPRNEIAVAYIDQTGVGTTRRLRLSTIEMASGSSQGTVVQHYSSVVTGTSSMRGVDATPFRDSAGNFDSVFALVDQSPRGVRLVSMQGENSSAPTVSSGVVGDYPSFTDYTVVPAIEAGRVGLTTKILVAYVIDWYGTAYIRLGTVGELSPGNWSFTGTDWLNMSSYGGCRNTDTPGVITRVFNNLAMAFDVERQEWGLGVRCGTGGPWYAHFYRINWSGDVISGSHMEVHEGLNDAHSPVNMAFNKYTQRYLFGFEHNTALIDASSIPTSCQTDVFGNCVTTLPANGNYSGNWAIETDYYPQYEFRVARATNGVGGGGGQGDSYELQAGQSGTSSSHWDVEGPGNIWPAPGSGWAYSAHDYARAYVTHRAAIFFVQESTGFSAFGQLRLTLVDSNAVVPPDE